MIIFYPFTEEDLNIIRWDIYSASYKSLNSSMGFLFLYLLLNPDIQTKLHQEPDKHLGEDRY